MSKHDNFSLEIQEEEMSITLGGDNDSELSLGSETEESSDLIKDYLSAVSTSEEDVSLTDMVLERTKETSDEALTLVSALGVNSQTGSKQDLAHSVSNIANYHSPSTSSVMKQNDSVTSEFTESEKESLVDLLIKIQKNQVLENSNSIVKKENTKVFEVQKALNNYLGQQRAITNDINDINEKLTVLIEASKLLEKMNKGRKLSEKDNKFLEEQFINLSTVKSDMKELHSRREHLTVEKEKVDKSIEVQQQLIAKERERISQMSVATKKVNSDDIEQKVKEFVRRSKKIVGIEFGLDLRTKDFNEQPIAIECSCGHVTITNLDQMPVYQGNNLLEQYKEKKQNKRKELLRDNNLVKLIRIPGINKKKINNEYYPVLSCESCESYLLFPAVFYKRLSERGFTLESSILDRDIATLRKFIDKDSQISLVLTEHDVDSNYIKDLGLTEYRTSKTSVISADPLAIEAQRERLNASNLAHKKEVVRIYHGVDIEDEVKLNSIFNEFTNHVENLRLAIKEMTETLKKRTANKNKVDNLSSSALSRLSMNNSAIRFLDNYRWILLVYGIKKSMSSVGLTNLVMSNIDNLNELKDQMFRFLVDYVIDCIIKRESIFLLKFGRINLVSQSDNYLPHVNFFECYEKIIRSYLVSRVKNTVTEKDLNSLHEILSAITAINHLDSYEKQIEDSEVIVFKLRRDMEKFFSENPDDYSKYEYIRNELFYRYMSDYEKYNRNVDLDNRAQAWFVYDSKITKHTISNYQLIDGDLFVRLYGDDF